MEEKVVLTVDEAAEYLGISRPQGYLGVHNGDIPSIRVGKRILIPKVALDKLLAGAGQKQENTER
ncbi:helix-turn-helix domain-containing protein [Chloroflexota bacterium]